MPHEVGSIIEGKVTGITKFGAFVDLGDGAVGMVHISEVSQSYVNDISEHLQEGQTVKVKVLNVGEDGKISLSIKRALPRPENNNFRRDNNNNNRTGNKPQQNSRPAYNNNRDGGNNFRRDNNNNRDGGRRYNDNHAAPQQKGPASFEDMLAKFMSSSDEKFSDMKQPERRRRTRNKNYNDYD